MVATQTITSRAPHVLSQRLRQPPVPAAERTRPASPARGETGRWPQGTGWLVAQGFAGFWIAFTILNAATHRQRYPHLSWPAATGLGMYDAVSWAITSVAAFWLARRLKADGRFGPALAIAPVAALVLVLARWGLLALLALLGAAPFPAPSVALMHEVFPSQLQMVSVFVIAGFGLNFFIERWRRLSRLAAQELALSKTRVTLLQLQIQPHLVFNVLNSVSALLAIDPPRARTMVDQLSEFLRRTEVWSDTSLGPLAREVELTRAYLELERLRYGGRLNYRFEVEESALETLVPLFILQPLVENAIRHGIARRTGPGHVVVTARRDGERLHLEVSDDGPGFVAPRHGEPAGGIGLRNTRSRLQEIYGPGAASIELLSPDPSGASVVLDIPSLPPAQPSRPPGEVRETPRGADPSASAPPPDRAVFGLTPRQWLGLGLFMMVVACIRAAFRLVFPLPDTDAWRMLLQIGVDTVIQFGTAMLAFAAVSVTLRHARGAWLPPAGVAAAGVAAIVAAGLVRWAAALLIWPEARGLQPFPVILSSSTVTSTLFAHTVATAVVIRFLARSEAQMVRERFVQADLSTAQSTLSTVRLEPGFLLHVLSAIALLATDNPNEADRLVSRLAAASRLLLAREAGGPVRLREELDLVRLYLEAGSLAGGRGVRAELRAADDAEGARIPAGVLLPLVEHTLSRLAAEGGGRLAVTGELRGDRLAVEIGDDGAGAAWIPEPLRQAIERRLAAAQGAATVAAAPAGENGMRMRIRLDVPQPPVPAG